MKRTIAKFGMTMAMLLSFLPVFADNINVGKLYYTILSEEDGTVEVTYDRKMQYLSGDIEIPNEINYNNRIYTVTSIGKSAFSDCSGLTSITIPNAVTSIGNYAFSGCSSLKTITFGTGLLEVENKAFYNCDIKKSILVREHATNRRVQRRSHCELCRKQSIQFKKPKNISISKLYVRSRWNCICSGKPIRAHM